MSRLSRIAVDNAELAIAPAQWSGDWVQHRLIEAYSVERRLPQSRRRTAGSAWPPMVVEWADVIGRADEVRQTVLQSWEFSNVGVSAADITNMEEAHDWLRIILSPYPQERLCLAHWAAAIAYHRSVRELLRQRRWSRTTFYRMVGAGAHVIALDLIRQGQPVG
jgi:hypothetical protein